MVTIAPVGDDTTEAAYSSIERIFFASAGRTSFADEADRSAFRERWLGRYLVHDREHVFLACDDDDGVVGYLVGCLDDPAQAARFGDISFYADFADLTSRYPAHLHINLDPSWRNQGVGGRLIDAFAQQAARAGSAGVHVVTGAAARNVGFYRRCGFTGLREAQWNETAILFMGREIAPERPVG